MHIPDRNFATAQIRTAEHSMFVRVIAIFTRVVTNPRMLQVRNNQGCRNRFTTPEAMNRCDALIVICYHTRKIYHPQAVPTCKYGPQPHGIVFPKPQCSQAKRREAL